MKINTAAVVCALLLMCALSHAKKSERIGSKRVGDVRVVEILDFQEMEKFDWKPKKGEPPLSAGKAVEVAEHFRKKHLQGKLSPEIYQIKLSSFPVNGKKRWFWRVLYLVTLDSEKSIKGRYTVSILVSLGGKPMVSIERIAP